VAAATADLILAFAPPASELLPSLVSFPSLLTYRMFVVLGPAASPDTVRLPVIFVSPPFG